MMTNEEKILAELEAIRAELATVHAKLDELKPTNERKAAEPTPAQQSETIRLMHELFPFTDEENAAFGKYIDELEREKGGVL